MHRTTARFRKLYRSLEPEVQRHARDSFRLLQIVAPHLRERGVTHLAVFGSVARGETSEAGDPDILVELDERRKKFALEDLFPETNVDLVLEDALKPAVRDRILSEARDVA